MHGHLLRLAASVLGVGHGRVGHTGQYILWQWRSLPGRATPLL